MIFWKVDGLSVTVKDSFLFVILRFSPLPWDSSLALFCSLIKILEPLNQWLTESN